MKKNKNPISRRSVERGSQPQVFSYYSNRSGSDNAGLGKLKKQVKKGFRWQLIPSFITGAVMLGGLIYASGLNTDPRVSLDKAGSTALLQNATVYESATKDSLKASIFNRSKLLINTKNIENDLLTKFPELQTAVVTVPLASRRPIVSLRAVEPRLLLVTDEGRYIIDANGRAAKAVSDDKLANELDLPIVQDQTGLKPDLGKVTLTSREVAFMSELYHQLKAKSINIESLVLPPLVNELHLQVKDQGYSVKFNLLGDARLQVGTWQALADRLSRDRINPAEYIDVRVDEKAFYK